MQKKPFEYVLLVDDDVTTNHVNKRLLLKGEFSEHVEVATDGNTALELLRNFKETVGYERPDLLLLDLKMEGMDGFQFLDAYAKLPDNRKAKLTILLTSSASFYDLSRLQEYTFVADHLYKPLSKAHLNAFVNQFLK